MLENNATCSELNQVQRKKLKNKSIEMFLKCKILQK